MNKWKQKNENFDELYNEGSTTTIVREINERYDRKKELKLSGSEYSVLSVLEEKWKEPNLVDDAKSLLRILGSNNLLFPGSFQQKSLYERYM